MMNRTAFLGGTAAFGAAGAGTASAQSMQPATATVRRHPWEFFTDPSMNFVFLIVLGSAYRGLCDVGATLAIIDRVEDGNAASAYAELTGAGTRYRAIADAAHAAGNRVSACQAYLQSANYTFAATYFCDGMGAPEKMVPTWRTSRDALDAGFALFDPPVEHVAIPYEGTHLAGYFFRASGASDARRPLVILNNGSDGSILDMWLQGGAAGTARGYHCLAFDGPGQGAALWEQHLPFRYDWEKVITPVVDFVLGRGDVDPHRIALQGISQGGYWAPRAVAFEHRIAAAIADPGCVDVSTSWTSHLPPQALALLDAGDKARFDALFSGPKAAASIAFRARPFGISSPFDLFTAVREYRLGAVVGQIACPMLITNPDAEQFFPGQPQQLYDALKGPKTLVDFTVAEGGEYHCEPMAPGLRDQRVFDWLDATLGYRSA
jgi:dienelactone hydrolase